MTRFTQFFALAGLLLSGTVYAQRELKDIPIPDPEEERKTFVLPEGFEVNLFALRGDDSAMERLCVQHAARFTVLPADLQAQVKLMRDADLDLLFIGGNVTAAATDLTAIALHRLARVQMTSICCCVTTGMRNIDQFLSGTLSEPADGALHYTEKLQLIDGAAHCFDFGGDGPVAPSRRRARRPAGLPEDAVVFASGANFHKIVPELQDAWIRILASVPDSRLLLYPFNPNWDGYSVELFMTHLADRLRNRNIDPNRLLVLEAAPTWQDVVQRLQLADIYLDSFPFCGATSLLDALLAHLPIEDRSHGRRRLVRPAPPRHEHHVAVRRLKRQLDCVRLEAGCRAPSYRWPSPRATVATGHRDRSQEARPR